jgi:hypothetical protein
MAERKPQSGDPFDRLRAVVDEWERRIDAIAGEMTGTDTFSRAMNQVQNLQLRTQRRFQGVMASHLERVNMPTRADVIRVGEALLALEQRVARMEGLLVDIHRALDTEGPRPPVSGPPRTRQPPSRGDAP